MRIVHKVHTKKTKKTSEYELVKSANGDAPYVAVPRS